jgi:rifamycin polyketide synthase module 9/10
LYDRGHRVFVEIGPHPMLLPLVRRWFADADLACVETARRDQDDALVTAVALAQLTRLGADLDLGAILPAPRAAVAKLPLTHRVRRFEVSG